MVNYPFSHNFHQFKTALEKVLFLFLCCSLMDKLALVVITRKKKRYFGVWFVSQCLLPEHNTPSPVYPTMHSHRYEPSVFVQVANWEQSSVFELHSSISDKGKQHWMKSRWQTSEGLIILLLNWQQLWLFVNQVARLYNFRLQFIVPLQYYRYGMFVNCTLPEKPLYFKRFFATDRQVAVE